MSYKDWYTINTASNGFICVAVDKDLNFVKQYGITMEGDMAGTCGCMVGYTLCRHKKMVTLFQKLGRVDSRRYYNHDKDKWMPPVKSDEA